MLSLIKGADSVELKLTIPESEPALDHRGARHRSARRPGPAGALLRHAGPDAREAGVVVRARRVAQKGDDSVVKLRPVVRLRAAPRAARVAGVHGRGRRHARRPRLLGVAEGHAAHVGPRRRGRAPRRCASCSPRTSGPSSPSTRPRASGSRTSRCWGRSSSSSSRARREGFARKMVVELWLYPDGARILELSTKCAPVGGLPGRRRGPRVPGRARHRDRRRRPDHQDAQGARVLLQAAQSEGLTPVRRGPGCPGRHTEPGPDRSRARARCRGSAACAASRRA